MKSEERDPLHSPVLQHLSLILNPSSPSSELRSPIALSMSEKKKTRKRSRIKRWLRSWVFTPLGNVRIKLINKVERRRRSISDCDPNQIAAGALSDRCPCRFFRDRNDQGSAPVRRSLLENEFESLVDLIVPMSAWSESARQQSSRLEANGSVVDGGEPAVATTKPKSPHDPRGDWREDEHSVLRVMNPDLSWLNSEDDKSEESGPSSVIEVDRSVYELSALGGKILDLPSELGEESQSGTSRSALIVEPGVQMANPMVIKELAPQLPDLYFIHQADPPLCCLITSALRDSSSPVLFDNGICLCDHFSRDTQPVISHLPSSVRAKSPTNTMEFLIRQTQRRRSSIVNNVYISPYVPLQPRPLQIRKSSNATSTNTKNDALSPMPAEPSQDVTAPVHNSPYSLHCKIQYGPLPPLPPSRSNASSTHFASFGPARPNSRPPDISSTAPSASASASASPVDLPQYPNRPNSMCDDCLARRHRSLHSHPSHRRGDNSPQFGNPPLPYPLSPQEPTRLPPRVDSLPASLRAGRKCQHCPTRRPEIVSLPVFVGPRPRAQVLNRISASFSDFTPDSPWAGPVGLTGFYDVSEDDLPSYGESDRIDESIDDSIDSSGLEMCLIAGSRAQRRRYR